MELQHASDWASWEKPTLYSSGSPEKQITHCGYILQKVFVRQVHKVWVSNNSCLFVHWRNREPRSCSVHRSGYPSGSDLTPKALRIPGEPLAFCLLKAEEAETAIAFTFKEYRQAGKGSPVGMHHYHSRPSLSTDLKQITRLSLVLLFLKKSFVNS